MLFVLANEVLGPLLIGRVSRAMLSQLLLDRLDTPLVGEGHLLGLVPLLLEEGVEQVLRGAVLEQVLLRRAQACLSK